MELKELRASIDVIDRQIVELFEKRMDVSVGIALAKKEAGLPIYDSKREEEKLKTIESLATKDEYKPFLRELYTNLFEYSKELQNKVENNEK